MKSVEKEKPKKEKVKTKKETHVSNKTIQMIAYTLGIVILISVLVLIVIRYKGSTAIGSSKRMEATSIEDAEENLPLVSLDRIFNEALAEKKYKQALRIKFLMILQELIDLQWIEWKKRKTNENYLAEINENTVQQKFKAIVDIFDDIWYGDKELSQEQLAHTLTQLENLHESLQPHEKQR